MSTSILFIYPKFSRNIGTIARNSELLGVSKFYVSRHKRTGKLVGATDTAKSFRRIGEYIDDDIALIKDLKQNGTSIISVELDDNSVSLKDFSHPEDALYILGSEDKGIPQEILNLSDHIVQIPSDKPWSFNVADSATITLYDRYYKMNQ